MKKKIKKWRGKGGVWRGMIMRDGDREKIKLEDVEKKGDRWKW